MVKNDAVNADDWRAWFASPAADAAKQTLASTKEHGPPRIGAKTEAELVGGLAKRRKQLDGADLYAALESVTLDDLRGYVAEHATTAVTAAADEWDRKRTAGWRRTRTGFQRFAMTFDRFLAGFQGVVEIVKLADNQYGGAATQVLSILFAVSRNLGRLVGIMSHR